MAEAQTDDAQGESNLKQCLSPREVTCLQCLGETGKRSSSFLEGLC